MLVNVVNGLGILVESETWIGVGVSLQSNINMATTPKAMQSADCICYHSTQPEI